MLVQVRPARLPLPRLARIPDAHRYGTPILVRADSAGATKDFLAHIRALRTRGIGIRFSVGAAITAIRQVLAWLVEDPDI